MVTKKNKQIEETTAKVVEAKLAETKVVERMGVEKNINFAPQSIQDISCKWYWQAPFFSTFLQQFKYVSDPSVPTMGVSARNGVITLHMDTKGWFESLSEDHKQAVLIHEILHLVHETHGNSRGKCFEHRVYNIAADICINEEILKSTIERKSLSLPNGACLLEMVAKEGYKGRLITEEIYDFLMKNKDKFNIQEQSLIMMSGEGSGDGEGNGQPQGDPSTAGEKDGEGKTILKPLDVHDGLDKNGKDGGVDEITKSIVQGITHVAKMRGYGTIAGNMQEYIREITTPTINWKQILRRFMKSTSTGSMFKMNNWTKANRRHLPLPGKKKFNAEYVIAVDTSGSVSTKELEMFFAEIDRIATFANIRLLQCDTSLTDSGTYKKGMYKKVRINGRGGTELSPIFKYMSETEDLKKSKLIVLTDGEFCYDFDTHHIDTMWALTKSGERYVNDMSNHFANHKFVILDEAI